jgi:hypothetical protein
MGKFHPFVCNFDSLHFVNRLSPTLAFINSKKSNQGHVGMGGGIAMSVLFLSSMSCAFVGQAGMSADHGN